MEKEKTDFIIAARFGYNDKIGLLKLDIIYNKELDCVFEIYEIRGRVGSQNGIKFSIMDLKDMLLQETNLRILKLKQDGCR